MSEPEPTMEPSSAPVINRYISKFEAPILEVINKVLKTEPWCHKSGILEIDEIQEIERKLYTETGYKDLGEMLDSAVEMIHQLFPSDHQTNRLGQEFCGTLWDLLLPAAQKVQHRSWGWLILVLLVTKLQRRKPTIKITAWDVNIDLEPRRKKKRLLICV